MAAISLKLEDLRLDMQNPRLTKSAGQREVLQKIIDDQDLKLVVLAESIVEDGLNPMDRWLVIKSEEEVGKYVVLEGNRRLAAIKLLNNTAVLGDLEVRALVKTKLEELAQTFDLDAVQPFDCFDIGTRAAAASWLSQRHTGENKGRGIVDWDGVASARFRGSDPALQAYDLVLAYGNLTDEEKQSVENRFPITTLDRLLSTPAVRELIGFEIANQKLKTDLPTEELIRPLRRIVLDLANGVVNVSHLKSKEQQVDYASKLGKDLPDLAKCTGKARNVDGLDETDFKPGPKPKPKPKPPVRKTLIPRECSLSVSNAKIAEISRELRHLPLADAPHSISVLFRVFLEQSVDHFLTASGIPLDMKVKTKGGTQVVEKKLSKKVEEAVAELVKKGVPKKDLAGVERGINDKNSPLYIGTLHLYVHSRFYSPTERELKVAWDNAQLFFESIWK